MRPFEGLEGDVEAARSEVFAAVSAATALRYVVEDTAAGRARVVEELARLEAEAADSRIEAANLMSGREAAADAARGAQQALEATRSARTARADELASARIELDRRSREGRVREQELAAMTARRESLEEFDATRAGYDDAPRLVLADTTGAVPHAGSVADYLEVPPPLRTRRRGVPGRFVAVRGRRAL